jgi:hypothetical protein
MPAGRPRKRDEDIQHGTDAAYRYCRAGSDGGRCNSCKDAHADAEARRAAARRGLPEPPPQPDSPDASVTVLPKPSVVEDDAPGPAEQSVLDEVETLSAAARRPSAVQAAVRLARNLDNPRLATSHATLAKQLVAIMDSLREASALGRRGRLASVAALSARRGPAAGVG